MHTPHKPAPHPNFLRQFELFPNAPLDWSLRGRGGTSRLSFDAKFGSRALVLARNWCSGPTSLPRMVHLSFSTDPAVGWVTRHPNARRFFRSRPETDRRAL